MIFCDTSFAAKLYAQEPESAAVSALLNTEDKIFVSELFRVELMAVFHRRLREGLWARQQFATAIAQFQRDDINGLWAWLPINHELVMKATQRFITLPKTTFLRAADCLHLATALHHGFDEIHTFDLHQAKVAQEFGL
ncbi:MAG: type II toxin-antitoxin system VapC family toxin [Verrucomicrobiales bacterium]|jgi:predicted nucleic acid-binding protein|nr:type II toxin-antitoxin system VapC family toxin [Verrucomicrobiales bacterium]